ncbi:MAG: hypothetical protein NC120_06765 [Ruminococcus sp.]|nr:hypothetical protein [Ruminococcus sp.]
MDNFSALLQLINPDNTMSVNRFLAHSMGMAETIIYSALISKYTYYRDNGKAADGWFYSTIEDLQESTTYGRKIQMSAIKKLAGYGLLETKLMGMPAKRYFRIISDTDRLAELIEKGQEICANMRKKSETEKSDTAETAQNSSLSDGANKIVPMGQTRLSQTDKQDCPDGTNKFDPAGQAYINLKGSNPKGNQSIYPAQARDRPIEGEKAAENKTFGEVLGALGYVPERCSYRFTADPPKCEEDFAAFDEESRRTDGCIIPYELGKDENAMGIALRFLFGYSYCLADTDKRHMDFADIVINALAEMACAEKTKIQDGYVLGRTVIDRLNGLVRTSSLADCLWSFEEKWQTITAETKIKNPRSYLKSTLLNWLLDYRLEDFCYAF